LILDALKTFGIDIKRHGKKFVDVFFCGEFNDKLEEKILRESPFDFATSISAVEHAGCAWSPNKKKITKYQKRICNFIIDISFYAFISVPFGCRPGWAEDKSRINFYQFDNDILDQIKEHALNCSKQYMEEIYMVKEGYWFSVDRADAIDCQYRSAKQGASAVALLSIWK